MVEKENNLDDIRKVYPGFTDEELRRARETLNGYARALWQIAKRLHEEGKSINDLE